MIVEDETILGEMYQSKFTWNGFRVTWVDSAEEGMKVIFSVKPDVVLLDILLPQASGIDFLKWLRKQEEIALTPVVAFSNYDEDTTKKEAFKLGAKDYIIKTNHTPTEIVDRINQILES